MICQSIWVKNFRNIEEQEVFFGEGVNLLVGKNAQGKTNLLEAIFYPSVGRSFRGAHTPEIIRFGESRAQILLSYRDQRRNQRIGVTLFRDRQRLVEKNGLKMDRLSDLMGSFRAVLFCPEHLSMIQNGPSARRSYMDMAISRMSPSYMRSLQTYGVLLRQRNALIKSAYGNRAVFDATVELWSQRLAEEAAGISAQRLAFIRRIESHVATCFSEMTGEREIPTLRYDGSSGQEEEEYQDRERVKKKYVQLLMSAHDREISAGATLWGIHKDDIDIRLNGRSARNFASQGQQRSLALAMKLAEGEICREEFGDYPVFLLDDVLSELDGGRREYVLHRIRQKQVILTGCDPDLLGEHREVRRILVEDGRYREEAL